MAYFGNANTEKLWSRVEPRTVILVLWLTACVGLLGYVLKDGKWLSGSSKEMAREPVAPALAPNQATVLVPIQAIAAGQELKPELFRVETRSIQGIEGRVFRSFDEVKGAYSISLIAAEAPLLKDYVTLAPPSNAVTLKIPEGYRGVTISVNEESAVEGWVRPGVKVDVIWANTLRGRPMVSTIVENAEVLSAERSTEQRSDSDSHSAKAIPSHVTLLVTLKDAQRIQLAKTSGSLSLNLRGAGDEKAAGSETITVDRLLKAGEAGFGTETNGWVQFEGREFGVAAGGQLIPSEDLKEGR